ncbi:MAG TPA: NAD(P)-binding domain-containing protein [Aggregatilineales bacterium]|nr:NAD(P)-binding domain-containing protein [Aggregatilineales bacterium]
MRIGILGSGKIGGTIGKQWVKAGHEVRFGVRDVNKPEVQALVQSLGGNSTAGSHEDAIAFGEVVLFAIPGATMPETVAAHAKALEGKIVIDAANKIGSSPANSLADFARLAPHAEVYRAFNNYGWENFEKPIIGGVQADLFYSGPDGKSRAVVEQLIKDVGLRPIHFGADQAERVDDILKIWIMLVREQKMGRHMAFKLLSE